MYTLHTLEESSPLPRSKDPRKEKREAGVFTLIKLFYFFLSIFILNSNANFIYFQPLTNTIILFLIPFLYTHCRDNWTYKDYCINFKIGDGWITLMNILIFSTLGYLNAHTQDLSLLILFFYSNVFLEELLFRGVIQSKLEGALGQFKSIFYQGILYKLIHSPKYISELNMDGDYLLFILKFGLQLINGIYFGLIYLKTRNIWISVICHYLNNYFGSIIFLIFNLKFNIPSFKLSCQIKKNNWKPNYC